MRKKLVVGNWKMNLSRAQATDLIESLLAQTIQSDRVEVAVCPSFVFLSHVAKLLHGTSIHIGAQDVFWKSEGAFTGCVSVPMLAEYACIFCIVGHSESRGRFGKLDIPASAIPYFAETEETVNLKVKALCTHSIRPIICVGETLEERDAGKTHDVIADQISGALKGIDPSDFAGSVIAYEPVWAIGTGKTCDSAEANRVCGFIRAQVRSLVGNQGGDETRILYGGSVKASNAHELFGQTEVDGGLVGGASLTADEFGQIVRSA